MICFDSNTFCVYVFDVTEGEGEGRGVSLKTIIITDREKFVSLNKTVQS